MSIAVEFWHLVSLFITFAGFTAGVGKMLLAQIERRQSERDQRQEKQIAALLEQIGKDAEAVARLEREFMNFKAELPVHYVRREDYVRGQSVIEAKLDALYSKLEVVQMNGACP